MGKGTEISDMDPYVKNGWIRRVTIVVSVETSSEKGGM